MNREPAVGFIACVLTVITGLLYGLAVYFEESKAPPKPAAAIAHDREQPPKVKERPLWKIEEDDPFPDGYWSVSGTQGKATYTGVATVTRVRSVYVVQWVIGTNSYIGTGFRKGKDLVLGWAVVTNGKLTRGVYWFTHAGGRTWKGRWTAVPGPGEINTEELTFIKALVPAKGTP